MTKEYLDSLSELMKRVAPSGFSHVTLEYRHFFSGAALYANGKICATLTPKGFAIKLPEKNREKLLKEGKARKLRYFPKAPIKKDYILLSNAVFDDLKSLRSYIKMSVEYVMKKKKINRRTASVV